MVHWDQHGRLDVTSNEPFDRDYMNALFELACDPAAQGYPWEETPPYWMERY